MNGHERRTSLSHSHSSRICYPASSTSQTSNVENTGLKIYLGDYSKNSLSESNMLCFEQLKIQNIKVYEIKTSVFRAGKWLSSAVKNLTSKCEGQSSQHPWKRLLGVSTCLCVYLQSQATPATSSLGRLVETVSSWFN